MTKPIFNPLKFLQEERKRAGSEAIATDLTHPEQPRGQLEATAAIYNDIVGQCPKCKIGMGDARVANGDIVFFCSKCRVSSPKLNTNS